MKTQQTVTKVSFVRGAFEIPSQDRTGAFFNVVFQFLDVVSEKAGNPFQVYPTFTMGADVAMQDPTVFKAPSTTFPTPT